MSNDNLKTPTPTIGNALLVAVKWVGRQFGHVWCLFIHGFIRDKHKMHKAYEPMECQINFFNLCTL